MDPNQSRGRPPLQGHNNHRSPTPSPHQYHDASTNLGLDPSVSPHAFTSGKFVTAQYFSTPYLESTQTQTSPSHAADPSFYSPNQFNQNAFHDNQWADQTLDPSYAGTDYLFQQQQDVNDMQSNFQNEYQMDNPLANNQHSNVNPADLSSPPGPSSPNLLSPESHASPPQPPSPASTQGHYYTPQHSRHQSLDPSSAAFGPGEWQGMGQAFQGHRRVPSEQSDISSNSASPYLTQHEVFESIENRPSPLLHPQQDGSQTFGLDTFTLADQPHISPSHSPYRSPRLLPQQTTGLGMTQEAMMGQGTMGQNSGDPGPEIFATQPDEPYRDLAQMRNRNDSTVSDMGQANQYVTPSINIEPAPVSRQASFEVDNRNFAEATLQPPARNRGRSKSDPHFRQPSSRSPSPAGRSPPSLDTHSVRSHSPGLSVSRESSPGPGSGRVDKNRRSSTSSIPTRDYILDLADPSRPAATSSTTSNRVQKHPATFECTLCPKRFTRAYNLRSHLRTHTDERPFVCTVCGKAFARQHDRKRHEGLHSGEKKFVCRGELGSGGQWGCGRRFARADALGRHFRSEAGRVCIKPLLDEEAAERERNRMEQQQNQYAVGSLQPVQQQMTYGMDASGVGHFTLPAALLAQYPALNKIDWSAIPQGEDPGEMSDVGVGRSSFDASSGGEFYGDEEIDNGYVSGSGMTFSHSGQGAW